MKINVKVRWLFLLLIGLVTVFSLPALAQGEKTDLTLRLVGNYYSEVKAGKDNNFFLEVRNTGTRAITNIRLSADKPEGWVVEFRPGAIDYLGANSVQTVDVNIKPAAKANKREYSLTLIAEANEIRRVESVWVRVASASYWLWVGVIVAAIVVAGFVVIFIRLSRQ